MFSFFKMIAVFCLIFIFFDVCQGQKKDVFNKENKAQAFAVLSAQYSKAAYFFAQKSYFDLDISRIKQNSDSAISLAHIASEYADSALNSAAENSQYAKGVMLLAKENQRQAILSFKQIKKELDLDRINSLIKKLMFTSGNAIVDAYKASLLFEYREDADSSSIGKELMYADEALKSKKATDERIRDVTRLETDEFSYMTVKELYAGRLVEINDELLLLNEQKNGAKGDELEELFQLIQQLKVEKEACFNKMKKSDDKLVNVKNDLSKEMLQIVHKDIFRTDKEGFYSDNVPIPSNNEIPNGLVFKIQIGFFKSQLPPEHFDGIFPLSAQKVDETYYRYAAGNFPKYNDAKAAKNLVVEKGYRDSFIVAYFNGEKISISEAIKKEKSTNY